MPVVIISANGARRSWRPIDHFIKYKSHSVSEFCEVLLRKEFWAIY
ncbi:hypothetical protein NOC27_602 [Nitrosococcus oceani AFC27]|nr:hypothetical protein NOC27_602 [Nitrosococcus oceani AFC27]